ncbi:MAG: tetratricopeptide repeat protein [Acidobacteriaceae bacterium]|nr:tetratricopeptide repeat protein [Acidobacteriaceae bacterium]MBV9779817.1 tetratricopeptide repeat protein [Acidobacteriaceae bacterium]
MRVKLQLLSSFLIFALSGRTDDRIEALERAADLIAHHELASADALLQKLLNQAPDDAFALNLLGFVRLEQQKRDLAEALFRKSIRADPRIPGPHINLAILYGANRPFDAIEELRDALRLSAGNAQAESLLRQIAKESALQAMRSGDKEKALAILMRAREANARDQELLYELGFVELEFGAYQDAQQSLEEALRSKPDYCDAMYALARTYLSENRAGQAEELMRKYLAAKPNDATAHYGLGYILMAEQKLEEAKAAFQKSLVLQPEQTESLFQLGEIAMEQGGEGSAREDFTKVLARDPKHGGALTDLGILAYRAGRYNEARTYLERAITSTPSYQKAHYYYALTLAKTGDKTKADREFEISRSLQKTHTANARLELTER